MYERILVATGGSPWSDAAVTYAMALAERTEATLHVVTVLTVSAFSAMPDMVADTEIVMECIEQEGQTLIAQVADRAGRAGVACKTVCAWGNVPATILRTAVAAHCDLIVLGTREVSGLKRLRLGGIANAVAAKATQPVLVVKQSQTFRALWEGRLLVATGGSPWSETAVDHALALAQWRGLEVCLLHVERKWPSSGGGAAATEGKNILALAEARAAAAGLTYDAVLASGNIVRAILETAVTKRCDAIVLGSRGLTGWKRRDANA